jgi:hypothetical protein
VNIPINGRLMTWDAAAPPSDMSVVWAPWERIHSIRTVLAIVAFAARGDRVEHQPYFHPSLLCPNCWLPENGRHIHKR